MAEHNRRTWKGLDPDELRRLYVDRGQSPTEIGTIYGYGRQTILNALAYHGIPARRSRRRKLSEDDTRELMRLYVCRRRTKASLARKFGVGVTTVDRYIRRHLPAHRRYPSARGPIVTELVDDYAAGLRLLYIDWKWSINSIATQFQCDPNDILDALRRLDVPVKDADDVHATGDHGPLQSREVVPRQQMTNARDAPATL